EEPRNERARLQGAFQRQPRSDGRMDGRRSGAARGDIRRVYLARQILSVVFVQLPAGARLDAGLTRPAHAATPDRRRLGNYHPASPGGSGAEYLAGDGDVCAGCAGDEFTLPGLVESRTSQSRAAFSFSTAVLDFHRVSHSSGDLFCHLVRIDLDLQSLVPKAGC